MACYFALTAEQLSVGSPHMQNEDDIQGMDDSDSPQDPVNIHHFLNYGVMYITNLNTHNFTGEIQDSGSHTNNCGSLSLCPPLINFI